MTMCGEASSGLETVEQYFRLRPDVLIMDLRMPQLSGTDAIREIRAKDPAARILVLSSLSGDETIHAALENGAMGYLLKENAGEQTILAIRAVMEGKQWLPSEVKQKLAERRRTEPLTNREKEILELLAQGEANKQIAGILEVSDQTVKCHVGSILGKLQARDRTEAVTIAIRRGIIRSDKF